MAKTSVSKKVGAVRRKAPPKLPRSGIGAVHAVQDKKAVDVVVLDLRKAGGFTDYFVICSGTSERQINALQDDIIDEVRNAVQRRPARREGNAAAGWVLLDYGDVVVHIFAPTEREYYRLEDLWAHAPAVVRVQ